MMIVPDDHQRSAARRRGRLATLWAVVPLLAAATLVGCDPAAAPDASGVAANPLPVAPPLAEPSPPMPAPLTPAPMDASALANALFEPAKCWQDGAGLDGLDPVSYHTGELVQGDTDRQAEHLGVRYHFASDQNRAMFIAAPARYAPSYGGYCAIALALGRLTCADARNFSVDHNRLFLFEVTAFTNGRVVWERAPDRYRAQADENFEALVAAGRSR